jgi:hypothetical protein
MSHPEHVELIPGMLAAVEEIKELIARHYPTTTFTTYKGEDPDGIYLTATLDVDDLGKVIDLYIDRLVDLQVEEGLPLFVIPERTPERTAAVLARERGTPGMAFLP